MTHRFFQNQFAGADVTEKVTQPSSSGSSMKIFVVVLFCFPFDQQWSPVGTIGDLAFGVILFFHLDLDRSRSMCVFWMMYGLYLCIV